MSLAGKVRHELWLVGLTTVYFATWFMLMLLLKKLILAGYEIRVAGLSAAFMGALVVAKVVLVLDHVSFGDWIRSRPACIEIALRTALYALGVLIVMLIEKSYESRHEAGGFVNSLKDVLAHRDIYHVWANTIVVMGALLMFNVMAAIRRYLGGRGLIQIMMQPLPEEVSHRA